MKKIILLLMMIPFFNCGQTNPAEKYDRQPNVTGVEMDAEPTHQPAKWYEGGTLHKSSILEWKQATDENKLATCGDFIASTNKTLPIDEIKSKAIALKVCIDEATRDLDNTNTETVASIASLCMVLLTSEQ